MNQNGLKIEIKKPPEEVFEFTTNPLNTHLWIESIEIEKSSEWPPKFGTVYRNKNKATGRWSTYIVLTIVKNRGFELVLKGGNYHVMYRYAERKGGITYMEYEEWVEVGELEEPFTQSVLEKLKQVMESS